jgi:hypothetical protein
MNRPSGALIAHACVGVGVISDTPIRPFCSPRLPNISIAYFLQRLVVVSGSLYLLALPQCSGDLYNLYNCSLSYVHLVLKSVTIRARIVLFEIPSFTNGALHSSFRYHLNLLPYFFISHRCASFSSAITSHSIIST